MATKINTDELVRVLEFVGKDEGGITLDIVQDDDTGRVFWEMEICGRWFAANTAAECFAKGIREFWVTPISEERLPRANLENS